MIGKTISHYKILEKLGEGGMGVVYKAEDTKLKRTVALKFLTPQALGTEEEKTRFVHEAQAAAALNHSNICTVYEIDDSEGSSFIAMEYIEGKSLKEKVESGPLKLDEAMDIAMQVAEGLREAHEKGIVHRDIKSANIMVTQKGHAKIMDFGLARMASGTGLTKEGTTLGTIAYMSPEQARGETVDHRTDVWSLGVIIYEMVTGRLPFKGEYDQAVIYSILNENPQPLTDIRTDAPHTLEQIVSKALEKEPGRRYQKVQEFLGDPKTFDRSLMRISKQEGSIVVLPFEDISPGKDNEYFSDGLTEEIISDLSQVRELRVISRTSAMMLRDTRKAIGTIGRELNVRYVLEGSVRKAGNNLRITAQLIDATNDTHIWADKYKGTLDDVFEIQEKVSKSIVAALKLKLSPEEDQRIGERPMPNVVAYDLYLRARHEIWRLAEDSLDKAIQLLENGLKLVGDNVLLFAAMGYTNWQYVNAGIKSDERYLKKAEYWANKVLELEPNDARGYLLLGLVQLTRGNLQEGVARLKRAHALDPNDPDILAWLGGWCTVIGKMETGRSLIQRLSEIDPLTSSTFIWRAAVNYYEGRFEEATHLMKEAYRLEPESPAYRFFYFIMLAANNNFDEASTLAEESAQQVPEDFFTSLMLFLLYSLQADRDGALHLQTEDFKASARLDLQYSWFMADGYSLLNEKTEALDWLESALDRGNINYPFLSKIDPFLENIRGEERFKKLMERVKYDWEHFEV